MFEEQAPTWTPKESSHFYFFNHLESGGDLCWGFMSDLLQSFSSKMDVFKNLTVVRHWVWEAEFLVVFLFSCHSFFHRRWTSLSLLYRTHQPSAAVLAAWGMDFTLPPRWHNKTALRRSEYHVCTSLKPALVDDSYLVTVTLVWPRCCPLSEEALTLISKTASCFQAAEPPYPGFSCFSLFFCLSALSLNHCLPWRIICGLLGFLICQTWRYFINRK